MLNKTFYKNIIRLIKSSKSRFFSLTAIVAVGVAFFVGVSSSVPIMSKSVDKYNDRYNLKDFTLYGNYGFSKEDIKAIEELDSVGEVEGNYFADLIVSDGKDSKVTRFHGYDENLKINKFNLVKGRLPNKNNEVLAEHGSRLKNGFKIGDNIVISNLEGEKSDILPITEAKVVGLVETPLYLNMSKETSTLNNMAISTYMYIPKGAFNVSDYLEANVIIKNVKSLNSFSKEYRQKTKKAKNEIVDLAKLQETENARKIKKNAIKEYERAVKKYNDGYNEYNDKYKKFQVSTGEGQRKLNEGKVKLEKSQEEIIKAKSELKYAEKKLNEEKVLKENYFNEKEKTLKEQRLKLNKGVENYGKILEDNKRNLSYGISIYEKKFNLELVLVENRTDEQKYELQQLSSIAKDLDEKFEISGTTIEKLDALRQKNRALDLENNKLKNKTLILPNAEKTIGETEILLNKSWEDLNKGKQNFQLKIAEHQNEISSKKVKLMESEEKIKQGRLELEHKEKELEKGKIEGLEKLREAKKELYEAKIKLKDGKKKIDGIRNGKWTVLDRKSHFASESYRNTINQMKAISKVFPVFFILVAGLVCLITMTRLVEEGRGEMGTMRALGYKKSQITFKYIFYALLATSLGILIGSAVGIVSFPIIIYDAWDMMYILPKINFFIPWELIVITAFIFLVAMCIATYAACRNDTKEVPSQLMRPKSPAMGKKTLLENVNFIWIRLNFTSKVTIRNIFRYKKRFFMTILGVSGCFALILIGFGIRDSISNMLFINYGDIIKYEGIVTINKDINDVEKKEVIKSLDNDYKVKFAQEGMAYTSKTYEDKTDETINVQVMTSKVAEKLYNLRTINSHKTIKLNNNGVILSQKVSENLKVKVGDSIWLEDIEGEKAKVKIIGINELYINHYALMTPEYYNKIFNKKVENNIAYISTDLKISRHPALAKRLSSLEWVEGVSMHDSVLNNFNSMVAGMKGIIWVLIISSMILAFVVLSNLIMVNISERQREIATLKVLGFRHYEVRRYIYSENVILTGIGSFLGIPLGIGLHRFIMKTVEMDNIMFDRNINLKSYIISFALTMVFSLIVNQFMSKKLRDIKMVESLKSVE